MNERKAFVALLTVIAVLLALNLVVKGTGRAEAQVRGADGEPYVVKYVPFNIITYCRVWSDGQIDGWIRPLEGACGDFVFGGVISAAVDHPFPVVDAHLSSLLVFTIEFEDGRVDFISTENDPIHCTIAGEGSAPFCIGDTDRSGVTDFQDIVNVLQDWGECVN